MHFIGTFNTLDNIIIGDPSIGNVVAEYATLSPHNQKKIEIECQPGTWYAYHFYGNYRYPVALILTEESLHFSEGPRNIQIATLLERGKVNSSFGQMVSAVDKQVMHNTMYTYIETSEDLLYRIKDVRNWLKDAKVPKEKQIKQLLEKYEQQGEHFIESQSVLSLCNVKRIPIESDIWASDCYFRLKDNPINASVILGGVLSKTYNDENTVYTDAETDCHIIYIDLDESANKAPAFRVLK